MIGTPKKILIIRQHNQLGDMLVGSSLLTALKEKYPDCDITYICGPQNKDALVKNNLISYLFVFNKKLLKNFGYAMQLWKVLRHNYDLVIVPSVVSISFTSNFLSRLANAKYRIGVTSLDSMKNDFPFFFNARIDLDWRTTPDVHVSKRILDILKPFAISTKNLSPIISFDEADKQSAQNFLREHGYSTEKKIIGLHVGAGKPPNRWEANNFVALIRLLNEQEPFFFLTGSTADIPLLDTVTFGLPDIALPLFLNKSIPEVAALIDLADLFITNDTGILHVAAATDTPQISLFGPTNPKVWGPVGRNKVSLKKSDDINEITVDEVFAAAQKLLQQYY